MNAVVALYIYGLVPEFLMRFLAWLLIHTFYRVDKKGLEHIPDDGPCIIVCNHVSYVDAVVIAACVRRPIRFVMDHRIFRIPLLSFIFRTMRTIPIAPAQEDARDEGARVRRGGARRCATARSSASFPRASSPTSGELNPFRPGVQQMIETTPVPVVPMALSRPLGQLLQPRLRRQGDAPAARHLLAHRARRRAAGAARARDARRACRRRCSRCAANGAEAVTHGGSRRWRH